MPLYGHELNENVDPLTASLAWAVDLKKDFVGGDALRKISEAGLKRKLLVWLWRAVASRVRERRW